MAPASTVAPRALPCSRPWVHRHACSRPSPRCPAVPPHAFFATAPDPPAPARSAHGAAAPSGILRALRCPGPTPPVSSPSSSAFLGAHQPAFGADGPGPPSRPDPLQLLRRDIRREPVHRSRRLPSTAAPSLTALAQRPDAPRVLLDLRSPLPAGHRPVAPGCVLLPVWRHRFCPLSSLSSLCCSMPPSLRPGPAAPTLPRPPYRVRSTSPPRSVAFRPPAPLPDRATTRSSFPSVRPSYALGCCCQGPFPLPMLSLRCALRPLWVRGSSSHAWSCPSASRVIAIWSSSGLRPSRVAFDHLPSPLRALQAVRLPLPSAPVRGDARAAACGHPADVPHPWGVLPQARAPAHARSRTAQ